ncbi:hypothetical protein HOLleu_38249 [Holothuria leucospilota]|uniref:DUF7630 domain-containing protein n=1 Tax=Holothuria leucospilota TaxID=206669 RepID=A0A9Q1BF45_HOLLE|nr:hypothetical protein HOLleu_38249 [Holothuria leucospilota]
MNCSNDFLRIKPGYFWHWNANDSQAYKNYVKNIQTEDEFYEKAWSAYHGSIPRAYKCPVETNCINRALDLEGSCQEGYQGWMCTVCQEGYYKLFGWCHKCHPEFVFGMTLLFVIFIAFVWFGIIKPLARNSQANDSRRRSVGDLIISRVKILFGFYQVVDSYWHSMGTVLWFASVQVVISRIIEMMSFTLSSIFVSPSCYISWFKWNPYTKLWTLYATLLLITFILVLVYFIACLVEKLRSGSRVIHVKTTCLKLFTFTMFASYAETCDVVFQLYNCDEFSLYEYNETPKIHLLRSHYNISCDTDIYLRYRRVFALPGWILISTFPVIMWSLLYKYSRNSLDHEMLGKRQYPEWLRFMCENYKSNCWYWEILELGRKVLLTFLPLAFGWEGVFIIIGLFASGLFLALHAFVRPMKDSWDNFLQFLSLLFLNFNMIVSAVHSSGKVEPVMYITVSIMNITIFAVLTGEAVWRTFMLLRGYSLCRCIRCGNSKNDELEPLLSAGSISQSDNATFVEDFRE